MFVVYDPLGDDSWQSLTVTISEGSGTGLKLHLQYGLFLDFDSQESTMVKLSETYYSNMDNTHTGEAGDRIIGVIIYAELIINGYTRFTPTGTYNKITSVSCKNSTIITKIPFCRYELPRTSAWKSVDLSNHTQIKLYYNADAIPNRRNEDGHKVGIRCTSNPQGTPSTSKYEAKFTSGFILSGGIDFEKEFYGIKSQFTISISSGSITDITFTSNWQVHDHHYSITYQAFTDEDVYTHPNEYNIWNFAVWFKTYY